jgi:hypothetical protein
VMTEPLASRRDTIKITAATLRVRVRFVIPTL